ncbi:MAG: efflux RND transporter periplasmic adaptor subunit [Ahrensia sp.]|nr:efflux RND transporter periplasmic adaptor subunit [Ahrensia sp.]
MSFYFGLRQAFACVSAGLSLTVSISCAIAQDAASGEVVRGVVKAAARVDLSTDIVAPIAQMPFLEGSRFSAGDILIKFDCGRYAADLRATKANANAAWVELKQKRYLYQNGAAGKSDVDLASAASAKSAAEIDAIEERMRSCVVKAPFDGRVAQVNSRAAELPKAGEPLMTIIDDSRIEIEIVVPSRWLRQIRVGTDFSFLVDETGEVHRARIDRLGAEVDPVSQTIQLFASFIGDKNLVLAGMSGDATFDFSTTSMTGAIK